MSEWPAVPIPPLGNGEIADVLERALHAAQQGAGPLAPLMIEARRALQQLRSDRRATQAKERLHRHLHNLIWEELSDEQQAINEAYVTLNHGVVPEWMDKFAFLDTPSKPNGGRV